MAAITAHRYLRGLPSAPPPWWVSVGVCGPPPPHWVAVTLIKEPDGAPAWMAPLYNVMGGSQDGSAGGGNTASVSQGGGGVGGIPKVSSQLLLSRFCQDHHDNWEQRVSGDPLTPGEAENIISIFARRSAHVGRIRRFSLTEGGGWRGGHGGSEINTRSRRLRLFHLRFLALAGFPRRAPSSSSV